MIRTTPRHNVPNNQSACSQNKFDWLPHFAGTFDYPDSKKEKRILIERFWFEVLSEIEEGIDVEMTSCSEPTDCVFHKESSHLVDSDTRTIKVPKCQFVKNYKGNVYSILTDHKGERDPAALEALQRQIEDLTLNFSEESMFASCPNIMMMMTNTNKPNAKEFLRGMYSTDKHPSGRMKIYERKTINSEDFPAEEKKKCLPILSDSDMILLREFGAHTIECLLVHTLCYLFNMEHSVSLASLIDRIESNVRLHGHSLLNSRRPKDHDAYKVDKKKYKHYPFGTALVEFLESRGLLRFTQHYNDELHTAESIEGIPKTFVKKVTKKNQSYYRSSFIYAECTFNTALLPVKLNLPMISPPKDWEYSPPENGRVWLNLTDIYGGYLSNPPAQIYGSHRTMTTPDPKSFFISFGQYGDDASHQRKKDFCSIINGLQRNAFKINSILLNDIIENRPMFEKYGLLMPEFLNHVILPKASGIIRTILNREEYKDIRSTYVFSELITLLEKNMQRARYECTILNLARAYDGYTIYFPAFIDFRGRIYRSGILHFHERDLSRSLLLFDSEKAKMKYKHLADDNKEGKEGLVKYLTATAFLMKSYPTEVGCGAKLRDILDDILYKGNDATQILEDLAHEARTCKRPLQFYSNVLLYFHFRSQSISLTELCNAVPVTQDASASAYQLMAYFLLDEELAVKTNLFQTDGYINDIYEYIRNDLIKYIKRMLQNENSPLCNILDRIMTRSLVKKIYMPLIYGKTLNSTTNDLKTILSQDVLPRECKILAGICFDFWNRYYSGLESFIGLINLVGRVCAALERPVLYHTPYFLTSQDYKKMESCSVRVFDTKARKRRSVTLTYPSNERDKRKSRVSTAVNLIHQKDAEAAMFVAKNMDALRAPLYTVHDNFISNTMHCDYLPVLYLCAIKDMGPPLTLINQFMYNNLIDPELDKVDKREKYHYLHSGYYDNKIIPIKVLDDFICTSPPSEVKNKSGWKKIREQLKDQYSFYCKAVCGPNNSFAEHSSRWSRFHSKMVGSYCLHH